MLVPMRIFLLSAVMVVGCGVSAAQTADRTAAPPVEATAAPPTRVHYTVQNGQLVVAPGLKIPNGNVPWLLDTVEGKQVLVPIHHAAVTAATTATVGTLEGASSKSPVHAATPAFFIHTSDRTENTGDAGRGMPTGWALVSAKVDGNERSIARAKFADVNSATVCNAPVLCTTAETLPEGWLRIVPREPLLPGEYALLPVPRNASTAIPVVYDFTVGEQAVAKDAVSPGQNLDAVKHKKK